MVEVRRGVISDGFDNIVDGAGDENNGVVRLMKERKEGANKWLYTVDLDEAVS